MTISKKLYSAFSITIVLLLVVSVFTYARLNTLDKTYTELIENRLEQVYVAGDIEFSVSQQGLHIRHYVLTGDKQALERYENSVKEVDEKIAIYQGLVTTDYGRELSQNIAEVTQTYQEQAAALINTYEMGQQDRAIAMINEMKETADQQLMLADKILKRNRDLFAETSQKATNIVERTGFVLMILTGLGIILSLIILSLIIRTISTPIKRLTQSVQEMAKGNLRVDDITVKSKDEISSLAHSFNEMKVNIISLLQLADNNATNLSSVATQLRRNSQDLTTISESVQDSTEDIVSKIEYTAQSTEESAAAMDDTAKGVQQIAELTQELHASTQVSRDLANHGQESIFNAKDKMHTIENMTKHTTERIHQLGIQSQEIQVITEVITGISDQTNLLALNAAIEAARAGEHGKGFAVVADEVRKLAEQSKESASNIVTLTSGILTEIQEVEKMIEANLSAVDQGVDTIQIAEQSFMEIAAAVEKMMDRTAEVSAVTEEISASAEQVAASISEIATNAQGVNESIGHVAQEVETQTASTQEINAIAENLTEKADELTNNIHKFSF